MRFVLAIVAFVAAACMIALGIAQRTVFLEPASVSLSTTVAGNGPYTVIDGEALTSHEGAQTLSIRGSGNLFMSYGRTADVEAWLGGLSYTKLSFDEESKELSSETVTGEATNSGDSVRSPEVDANGNPVEVENPNPRGSDLWLDEWTSDNSLANTINVPEGISVLVATDGTAPAPKNIRISWPLDNSTPWAGPLVVSGAILLLVGLALYLWALLHMRRSRGPRRNLPKGRRPKLPKAPKPKMIKISEITGSSQRKAISPRSAKFVALPVLLISGLVLSGCSASFWPDTSATTKASAPTPAPDVTEQPEGFEDLPPAAVTVPQLERIVRKIAVVANEADTTMNAELLNARFAGPALLERQMNYKIRAGWAEQPLPAPIPASPLQVIMPQQNASWPRSVVTVILNEDQPTIAPMTLVLTQKTPRDNYLVEYAITLAADTEFPEVAPASIGSPPVAPDSKFLEIAPDQLAAAYGDLILKGPESEFYELFDTENDSFLPQVGVEMLAQRRAGLAANLELTVSNQPGSGPTIALGTIDSGAIVAVNLDQFESTRPTDGGNTSFKEGPSKALSGVDKTSKGVMTTRTDQLLFYVPSAGADEKIRLLGFAHSLTAASEIP